MKKSTWFLVVYVVFASVSLTGCDPEEEAEIYDEVPGPVVEISSYPLSVGNKWNYVMTLDITGPDAGHTDYLVKFESLLDTTIETMPSTKIRNSQSAGGGAMMYVGDRYYHNASHGLDLIAVDGSAGQVFFKASQLQSYVSTNSLFQDEIAEQATAFTILDSALHLLKYPSVENDSWWSNEAGPGFNIKRKWTGYYTVTTEAGSFNCMRLESFRDVDDDGQPDPDWYELTQFISPEHGLIKEVQISPLNYIGGETGILTRELRLSSVNF